ncbi:hypothetical protein [Kitasatospora albolonga]
MIGDGVRPARPEVSASATASSIPAALDAALARTSAFWTINAEPRTAG